MIGSQSRGGRISTLFCFNQNVLKTFDARNLQGIFVPKINTNWPRFFGWTIFSSKGDRNESHAVCWTWIFCNRLKRHQKETRIIKLMKWEDFSVALPTHKLVSLMFWSTLQKVWKYSSLTLPTSKSWGKSTWSNVPWVFSQDFSLSRPRLEPRHLPGTFHLEVFLHHPTEPSTLQRTEFFSGEDLVKFHHIFGEEANQIFVGRFFRRAFWTAHFWHSNRFLAQKSYLHIAWRHGRHTKALCQKEDDAYGSLRMIFAFMFFGSHTCFERLHFNRSACHIKESTTWPVCCFWGTPGGHLGANWCYRRQTWGRCR